MVNQYCAHSFARNWQLPFLNQRKGENDRRKYFMINLHERMLRPRRGLNPRPPGLQSDGASNWVTEALMWIYWLIWTFTAVCLWPLQKHAYSKISPPKTKHFQIKKTDIFHISAQNIDCGYSLEPPQWGSFNEYQQSMFLSRNKKNNIYPCKPQFYYTKVGAISWQVSRFGH